MCTEKQEIKQHLLIHYKVVCKMFRTLSNFHISWLAQGVKFLFWNYIKDYSFAICIIWKCDSLIALAVLKTDKYCLRPSIDSIEEKKVSQQKMNHSVCLYRHSFMPARLIPRFECVETVTWDQDTCVSRLLNFQTHEE